MAAKKIRCFISHTWREQQHCFAMKLSSALREKSIAVWIDENEIRPVDFIEYRIKRAIERECDVFLLVLSPEALASKWCRRELNLALDQRAENCMPVIPVLLRDCRIPRCLKDICYADFRDSVDFDIAIKPLVEGIQSSARLKRICGRLSSPRPRERMKSSKELGDSGNPLALGPLKYRLLFRELDGEVKHYLALAISQIGGIKAIEILSQAMMVEEEPLTRQGIIWGMIEALEKLYGKKKK